LLLGKVEFNVVPALEELVDVLLLLDFVVIHSSEVGLVDPDLGHAPECDPDVQLHGLQVRETVGVLQTAVIGPDEGVHEDAHEREDVHSHAELVDHVCYRELLGEHDLFVEDQKELTIGQVTCEQVLQLVLLVTLERRRVREEDQNQKWNHQRFHVFLRHALDEYLLLDVATIAQIVSLPPLVLLGVLDLHAVDVVEVDGHQGLREFTIVEDVEPNCGLEVLADLAWVHLSLLCLFLVLVLPSFGDLEVLLLLTRELHQVVSAFYFFFSE